mgnify:CR=1 FL=1
MVGTKFDVIGDYGFPEDTFIGAIVRDNIVISPKGNTIIELGDKIVMCLLHDAIQRVEDFLSEDSQLI